MQIDIEAINGNTQQAIDRKQVVGILANTIGLVIRNEEHKNNHDQADLIRFAIEQLNDGFVSNDWDIYQLSQT